MGVLDGKVAVVVGGTSGIGAQTATLFAAEGAQVVVAGRRQEQGAKIVAELGGPTTFVRTDVTVEREVEALITQVVDRLGRLDVLVNSAGEGGSAAGIAAVDLQRLHRTLAAQVGGATAAMKYAAPVMVRQGSGSIVNVASIGGLMAGWTGLDYSAAKAAVVQLTRCVAVELAASGVRVNSISPGPILTGIFGKAAGLDPATADDVAPDLESVFRSRLEAYQPIARVGVPADVAPAALWLASDASAFVTGQDIAVDGGITAGRPAAVAAADRIAIGRALVPTGAVEAAGSSEPPSSAGEATDPGSSPGPQIQTWSDGRDWIR